MFLPEFARDASAGPTPLHAAMRQDSLCYREAERRISHMTPVIPPIVVGFDGSHDSRRAAAWAAGAEPSVARSMASAVDPNARAESAIASESRRAFMIEVVIRGALIPDSTLHEKRGNGVRKNIVYRFHRSTGRSILRLRPDGRCTEWQA